MLSRMGRWLLSDPELIRRGYLTLQMTINPLVSSIDGGSV